MLTPSGAVKIDTRAAATTHQREVRRMTEELLWPAYATPADATRRAVADALAGLGDGVEVDAVIEDGSVVAAITVAADTSQAAVKATLDQYAIRWTLAVRPGRRDLRHTPSSGGYR